MEEMLELSRKLGAEAEVYKITSEETTVKFEANRLKHIQGKQSSSTSLRIIKDGKIGYATTSGQTNPEKLVNAAVETSRFGMEAKFKFPSFTSFPEVTINDAEINKITMEEMIKLCENMIAPLREHTPDLLCEAGVSKAIVTVELVNSSHGKASYTKSIFSLGVEGTLVRDTDMLFVGDYTSSCQPVVNVQELTRSVIYQLECARRQAKVSTGKLPVIFTPDGFTSAFIASLTAAFNGKLVLEGASPIGNSLGKLVFDEKFTLIDDTLINYKPGSRPCDDEGVPSQRTLLVEKGRVTAFLYDLQTAARAGKKSTGNGIRGGGLPSPAPGALVIEPGNTPYNEMLKDIKEGLVIEQLMGAEQGNVLGGEFSGNVLLGYKVENGEITGRVKDTMISGNIYDLLKNIIALSEEHKWVGGFMQVPYVYLPAVSVASR